MSENIVQLEPAPGMASRSIDRLLQRSAWVFIALLLFLRVALFGWLPVLTQETYSWIEPVYQIATYGLTALFIYAQRERLAAYHFDKAALFIFLSFKPLQTLLQPVLSGGNVTLMSFPHPTALAIWIIAGALLVGLWPVLRQKGAVRSVHWGWLLAGCISGPLLALILGFALIPWAGIREVTPIYDITLLLAFPYQIGYAGVDEEPLFRGLLWGALRKRGWREGWVLVFQAAVFMLAHGRLLTDFHYYPYALSIFVGGIVLGLLAWRSRSTATSMLAHGFYNASSILVAYLISGIFFKIT